jgi:CarD family transcriptional regulator
LGVLVFHKGDRVVYPRHGAAVIEDLVELEMSGKLRSYFKLRLPHGNLTLMVPIDSVAQVGLRRIASGDEVGRVFDLLREEESWTSGTWGERYRTNLAKVVSGDIYQLAEVVRDLSLKQKGKVLSAAEKRMLIKSREILISELTFAVGSTEEDAEAMMDEVLEASR